MLPVTLHCDKLYKGDLDYEYAQTAVPFEKGCLRKEDLGRLVLTDGERSYPLQTLPTAFWKDGSIRFLLVRFLGFFPGNRKKDFQLSLRPAGELAKAPDAPALTVRKKEGGYASFSSIQNRPHRYLDSQWDSLLDWDMLNPIDSDLKDGTLESIEKCLELAFRYGIAGNSTSRLSLDHLESSEQTENRVLRYIALRESVSCCGKAIECIDNAAQLLGTVSESAPFVVNEFALNYRLITSPDLWEQYMEWYPLTIRRMQIDIYNALADYLAKQLNKGTTDKIQQYLENALMQLAQSISILSEACVPGIINCQFSSS